MDDQLLLSPATRLAAAVRAKELSSRELLAAYLARVDRLNPQLNAVVTLDPERALAEAQACDADLAAGRVRGPLHGLPITVKDAIEVAGLRSTGGASELAEHVPSGDAPVVARLREAGAVVFGKTNVPRWSGDLQTYNDVFGTTNNPWDPTRTPGGSSGGAAAAVATGLTSFETGTDIGGSVRFPSHFCGVFGLKTSYGVVSQRGYLDQVGGGTTDADINVFGPIARSADDLDLLLDVIAGPPPEQAAGWRLELPGPSVERLAGARVAVWLDEPSCPADPAYAARLRAVADAVADAGAQVVESRPPVDFLEQVQVFNQLLVAAIAPSLPEEIAEAAAGNHLTWLRLQRRRAELAGVWARWFRDVDALLCPVTLRAAFPHTQDGDSLSRTVLVGREERPYLQMTWWTGLIGVLGLPSAVPPVGLTDEGLPVGVQVVAPYLHDRTAVAVARAVAEVAGGYQPPPMAR